MDFTGLGRAFLAAALLAFVPGFSWSFVIGARLRWFERLAISIVTSIALMVLALYLGSAVASIDVSAAHAIWWSLALTLAGGAVWAGRWRGVHRPG